MFLFKEVGLMLNILEHVTTQVSLSHVNVISDFALFYFACLGQEMWAAVACSI